MLEIYLHRASVTDIDLLVGLMRQFYAIDQYPFNEQIARGALKTLIEDPSLGRLWIIKKGVEDLGYVVLTFGFSLEFHGRDGLIDELFIVDMYRNQGIGTQTFQLLNEECRSLDIHALHLEVERTNRAGQALYRKMGFEAHEQRYLMTKWLES